MATIIIGAALAVVVALIITHMVREKKKGHSSCGCNCGSCPMSGGCHHRD